MTSNHRVDIVVGVRDMASSALRGIESSLNNMNKGFSNAGSFFNTFSRGLESAIGQMDKLANSMYKFNMYTSSLQRNLQNVTMLGVGAAGALAIQGTQQALSYDYKMRTMQSRMGVGDSARENISNFVLNDPSMKTAYKPTDIADMGITLGQAGISSAPDMKALMKSVSYFAESVDAVPDQAAEMVIAAAKGFGISMQNSQDITDKLTVALNQSLLQVDELPHAIGELAGRANMYGQSLDSSLTAIMTMRNQGVDAAQGSQNFLHALTSASRIGNDQTLYKKTEGYFSSLGVTDAIFNPDTRQLKEFPDLIADMQKALIKQGFVNPKYKSEVKDEASFQSYLDKNGGIAPKDFWDSEKAMPLITRVFGSAGTAPILAGLQSQFQATDANGNPTGKMYYGADALKQMYNQVHDSSGAVDQTHATIAESGQYQLQVLGGAWQAAQIKLLDGLVPLIKTGAEQVSNIFNPNPRGMRTPGQPENLENYEPYKSPFDVMREAVKQTSAGYNKDGHTTIGGIVNTVGNGVVNGAQIATTMPKMFNQIGGAFNKDIISGHWGSNLLEFPMDIVNNGIKFISDLVKANKSFNDEVKKLPKDLQDPAQLMETLTKGGIVLMVSGVIAKTIELGVRGVSGLLTAGKTVFNLSKLITDFLMDKDTTGKGSAIGKALGSTMGITANIVNVYGKVVNGGGGSSIPGGANSTAAKAAEKEGEAAAEQAGQSALKSFAGKVGPWALLGSNIALLAGSAYVVSHPKETNQMVMKNPVQKVVSQSPLSNQSDKKIDEMYDIMKNPSKIGGSSKIVPKQTPFVKFSTDKGSDATTGTLATPGNWKWVDDLGKKFMHMFPDNQAAKSQKEKDEAAKAYSETAKQIPKVTTSIVDGFGAANNKLQNLKLQNAVSVVVQPPQVHVTGVPNATVTTSGASSFSTRDSQGSGGTTAYDRMNEIMQRRIGWR